MRRLILLIGALMLLAACAPLENAYYVDKEFGKSSQAAWDQMVINKNAPHGDQTPTGLDGVAAEEIMNVTNQTFAEKTEKTAGFSIRNGWYTVKITRFS